MSEKRPPTRRVEHGSSHRYFLDGYAVKGVTTIRDAGVPKPALIDWAARETAGYAVDHWDELAELTPSARLRLLDRARFEGRDSAAGRGTDVHALVARLARGEAIEPGDALVGLVDAYLRFADDWIVDDLLVEAIVANRRCQYMGTLDLIADLVDGRRWLLDFKTGSGVYSETELQLAAYRYAEFYVDPETGEERPLPEVDATGAVWLREDGYDLLDVEADEAAFAVFRHAQQVAKWSWAAKDRGRYEPAVLPARRLEAAS